MLCYNPDRPKPKPKYRAPFEFRTKQLLHCYNKNNRYIKNETPGKLRQSDTKTSFSVCTHLGLEDFREKLVFQLLANYYRICIGIGTHLFWRA